MGAERCWPNTCTATICPPHGRVTGLVATGVLLPEALYFSSETKSDAPSRSWRWASLQLLAGRAWSPGDAVCQCRAPCLVCAGGKGPFSRQCLAGLASRKERQSGADAEAVGRVNSGRSCCLCMQGCVCGGCMPAKGKAGCSGSPLGTGSSSVLVQHSTSGTCRLLQGGGYGLIPYVEGLRHLPFL